MPTTSAPLSLIAATSSELRTTAGRKAKVALLTECLRGLLPDERAIAADWLSGSLRQGRLGVGWAQLRSLRHAEGAVAVPLTVSDVDRTFDELAKISGPGSRDRRRSVLVRLFDHTTSDEADFLRALLLGNLRQGALRGLMLEAVAEVSGTSVDDALRAHTRSGSVVGALAPETKVTLFQPLAPMLAGTASDVEAAVTQLEPALVEAKADGARVQVHRRGDEVRVYTRSGKGISAATPEIVEAVRTFSGGDLILDGEALVWVDGRSSPFQVTMRRIGAVRATAADRARFPLRVFFFDCLLVEGTDLLDEPLEVRRRTLLEHVPTQMLLPHVAAGGPEAVEAAERLLADVQAKGFEGVIAKALDAPYAAGRRGRGWLKVKPVHTLDLVVLAAEWGSGRRKGWLSNLHLGARDEASGDFVMLGKTFKGLTDALLKWQTEALLSRENRRQRGTVWVRPELVVEIAFDGVQASRKYPGGVTLRFARVKQYRPDKKPAEADTIEAVRALLAESGASVSAHPLETSVQTELFDASS